jgi:hypothetical protein
VADEAMLERRTVRDQATVLIERALGLRRPREAGDRVPDRRPVEDDR